MPQVEGRDQADGPTGDVLGEQDFSVREIFRDGQHGSAYRTHHHAEGVVTLVVSPYGVSRERHGEPFKDGLPLRGRKVVEGRLANHQNQCFAWWSPREPSPRFASVFDL